MSAEGKALFDDELLKYKKAKQKACLADPTSDTCTTTRTWSPTLVHRYG